MTQAEFTRGRAFGHERTDGRDEWLTPPEIIRALGEFDLDPCAPVTRPWPTALRHFSIADDGLAQDWVGRVWMNPPYGKALGVWMERMAEHGNGIALIFARTETEAFHRFVWGAAQAVLFLRGRLKFYNVDGTAGENSAGVPSVLVAYGKTNADCLAAARLPGKVVYL